MQISDRKKALALAAFTVIYNIAEGGIAILASSLSGSTALWGFGLDSFIESLSGGVILWRFGRHGVDALNPEVERIERRAEQLVGITFLILGTYVCIDAGLALWQQSSPESSGIGLILAVASLIIMPILYLLKYRLGKRINSRSLIADAKETLACTSLTVALLIGLTANYLWGLWWLDPVAAIVIAVLVLREGREMLTGCDHCADED
ncbi:cation diffusion facilitator family transporter [Rubinisphaera margarita]|uniref:cation diffusion facilitator family transporter n=1 Tax=Rubinisphaera margarita TaxID=2909586 RepID=UPI001EE872FF|nr:cation transporter [Rubinisphaera margarita]MCG6158246.1 cation transporter [Rubinisphaera margarita]